MAFYNVGQVWVWRMSVPGLTLKDWGFEKPLSPGKTGMIGYYSEVSEGLDEFGAVHGGEQSSVGGRYLATIEGKGGNEFMSIYNRALLSGGGRDRGAFRKGLSIWGLVTIGQSRKYFGMCSAEGLYK